MFKLEHDNLHEKMHKLYKEYLKDLFCLCSIKEDKYHSLVPKMVKFHNVATKDCVLHYQRNRIVHVK